MHVGSRSGFSNSDLLDPDPAENGPEPQPCINQELGDQIVPYRIGTVPPTYARNLKEEGPDTNSVVAPK